MKEPVVRLGAGKYRIDVLAVRDAIQAGTLFDEAIVEKILPGLCSKIRASLQTKLRLEEEVNHADPA